MKKLKLIFGAVVIAVSAFFFYYSGTFQRMPGQKDIGPGAFPRFVCGLLILSGILLILREIKQDNQETVYLFSLKFFMGLLSIFCYFLLLKGLGFILDSIWIVAVMMLMLLNEPFKKAWPLIAGVSVGVPTGLYMIFGVFLKVPIPNGLLSGIL